MKQFFHTIFLLICTNVFSQTKAVIVIDSIVFKAIHEDDNGDHYEFFEVDSFDINGLKRSSYSQGGWIISEDVPRITWEYNHDGKVISKKRWYRDNGFILSSEDNYHYNSTGQLTFHSTQYSSGFYQDTLVTFDSLSRIKSILLRGKDSVGIINLVKHDYLYSGGRLTNQIISKWINSSWQSDSLYTYSYSSFPFPDTVNYYFYNNNNIAVSNSRSLVYKNNFGKDSVHIFQNYNSSVWNNVIGKFFTRNQNQQIISILYYEWYIDHWEGSEYFDTQYWSYNSLGLLTYYETEDTWSIHQRFITYDSVNNINVEIVGTSSLSGHLHSDSINYSYIRLSNHPFLENFDFSIYPNPVSTSLTILIFSNGMHTHTIDIYNTLGQLMLSENIELSENYSKLEIPLNGLSQGLYFLKVSNIDSKKVKKFLISN